MRPIYESIPDDIEIYYRESSHFSPHIHDLVEFVYILDGTLEIGMDERLFHMEKGDIAILFPGKIHHAQCFDSSGLSYSMYLLASLSLTGDYEKRLRDFQPESPVIPAAKISEDVIFALDRLYEDYGRKGPGIRNEELFRRSDGRDPAPSERETERIARQSFVQLILARTMPYLKLVDRPDESKTDLVHQIVSYIAAHYREPLTLTDLAKHLYVSPYTISRTFSSVFHTNFNGYLNDMRLDYACSMLQYSSRSITEVGMDAGFESQRTFNRTFRDRMRMSPREYRAKIRAEDTGTGQSGERHTRNREGAESAQGGGRNAGADIDFLRE